MKSDTRWVENKSIVLANFFLTQPVLHTLHSHTKQQELAINSFPASYTVLHIFSLSTLCKLKTNECEYTKFAIEYIGSQQNPLPIIQISVESTQHFNLFHLLLLLLLLLLRHRNHHHHLLHMEPLLSVASSLRSV